MKSLSFRIFVVMLVITANVAACKHVAYEYSKGENNCPYEGLECPNALAIHTTDSLAYADAEYVIDSLVDENTKLKTQLAGCEFQDHSKLVRSN